MATKNAPVVRRKKKRSVPVKRRKGGVRRRRGMLGDMLNPTVATNSAKSVVASGLGGATAAPFQRILPRSWGTLGRIAASLVVGFVGHSVLQAPNVASGFVGGNTALITAKEMYGSTALYEDGNADYVPNNALRDAPLFLDEDGNVMMLNDDGDYQYLTEDQLNELEEYEDIDYIEV